jgi:hypothetical protein
MAERRCLYAYAVLVDFRMAFVIVDRALSLNQWRGFGISGVFLDALTRLTSLGTTLYQHIHVQVQVNGGRGPSFATTRGTK